MDESKYYGDPCSSPSLSYSIARTLLKQSPYHAWLEHPRLGGEGRKVTKAMDLGKILHAMLLGTETNICWLDFPDYRTKAAQNARDEAEFNGKIPMLDKETAKLTSILEATKRQLADFGVSLDGQVEGTVLWCEQDNKDRTIYCRSRLDLFDGRTITDIKFVNDANPQSLLRKIIDMGYDIQAAAYCQAVARQCPELKGKVKFRNLFCETEPPYLVTVVNQDESLIELGRTKWSMAINLWSECLHSNKWPAYGEVTLSAPAWAMSEEISV